MKERLKNLRKNIGFTQVDFAAKIGVSNGNVGDWERGRTKPGADALAEIVKSTGVSALWLLTGEGDMFPNTAVEVTESKTADYQQNSANEYVGKLTLEQAAMLYEYEKLNDDGKKAVRAFIQFTLAEQSESARAGNVSITGEKGLA